jgi:tetratricopeptide (TPR) repeat protein
MSLLLQALQKAAKNREEGDNEETVTPAVNAELALEPVSEPDFGEEPLASPAPSPAQAATVMRASETPRYTPIDWMRDHYMITFVSGAVLFAIGYGLYIYIQISNPGFLRPSRPATQAPMQMAAAPAPAPASAAKISGMPDEMGTIPAAAPETAQAAKQPTAAAPDNRAPSAPATTASARPAPVAAPAPSPRRTPRPRAADTAAVAADARNVTIEDGVEVVEIPPSPAVATAEAGKPAREEISIRRQGPGVVPVKPQLQAAYEALQQGDYANSRTLYSEVLADDPRSIDALLGMAAIAWKQGRAEEASRHYARVLELDPRNTYAQAGLISMLGSTDRVAAESRLKQLIGREPSGFLYFTLGNLYAEQGAWPAAQQAYFQAYQFQPDNADYAFNLAVGLEHLGQPNLALDYYRKALDLSFRKGRANFDQGLAIQRVGQLSGRVE